MNLICIFGYAIRFDIKTYLLNTSILERELEHQEELDLLEQNEINIIKSKQLINNNTSTISVNESDAMLSKQIVL